MPWYIRRSLREKLGKGILSEIRARERREWTLGVTWTTLEGPRATTVRVEVITATTLLLGLIVRAAFGN